MGITRLANVTGLDNIGIPVVMACRPNSRALAVSQGKGWDLDAAKASAAMESIESYHAERVHLPLKLATYEELKTSERVVDPNLLPPAADSRFHAHLPILWTEGDDWLQQERVWVPFQLVHTTYTADMRFDLTSFASSSTGLASGNHFTEAVSHGICEVVERDAAYGFSLLSAAEQASRKIDLDTVDHPQCRELLERCHRVGVAVGIWDLTSDVGLASFQCSIVQRDPDPVRRLYSALGYGCHPVRHIAFQRALTEAAQSRLTAISGSRDDAPRAEYQRVREPELIGRERERASAPGLRSFAQVPSREADSFEEDLQWELQRIRQAGFERVIILDLTLPEFGIPVVRAIVPGMERLGGREPKETQA